MPGIAPLYAHAYKQILCSSAAARSGIDACSDSAHHVAHAAAQAMSSCAFGRAGARCVRPYAELEAHCDASGERFPLLAMRLACGALTAALQPPGPSEQHPGVQRPRRGDPLTVRADKDVQVLQRASISMRVGTKIIPS